MQTYPRIEAQENALLLLNARSIAPIPPANEEILGLDVTMYVALRFRVVRVGLLGGQASLC